MWQRWNQSTHIFEKSENNGSSWVPLPLSADIITEGALAKARQHAQTPYKDESNTFVQEQHIDESTSDLNAFLLRLKNTNTGSNARALLAITNGGGDLTDGIIGVTGGNYSGGTFINDQFIVNGGSTLSNGLYLRGVNGLQLAFPATQLASSDANTLDDYEEGTWTPTLLFGGATTGITYSATRTGRYVKVGKLVVAWFAFILTSKGTATGAATISGLPITGDTAGPVGTIDYFNLTGLTGAPYILLSQVTIHLAQTGAASRVVLLNSDFTNTTDIRGSLAYLEA